MRTHHEDGSYQIDKTIYGTTSNNTTVQFISNASGGYFEAADGSYVVPTTGVTDLAANIAAIISGTSAPRTIVIPVGSFNAASTITVPTDTSVVGCGWGTQIVPTTSSDVFTITGDRTKISDVYVKPASGTLTSGSLVYINNTSGSRQRGIIENILCEYIYNGITNSTAGNNSVYGFKVENIHMLNVKQRALAFYNTSDNWISKIYVDNAGYSSTADYFVRFEKVTGGTGNYGGNQVQNVVILSRTASSTGGFHIKNYTEIWFRHCLADTLGGIGWFLDGGTTDATACHRVFLHDCWASLCQNDGFKLQAVKESVFTHCYSKESYYNGWNLVDNTEVCRDNSFIQCYGIENNKVGSTIVLYSGFYLDDGSDQNIFVGCQGYDNSAAAQKQKYGLADFSTGQNGWTGFNGHGNQIGLIGTGATASANNRNYNGNIYFGTGQTDVRLESESSGNMKLVHNGNDRVLLNSNGNVQIEFQDTVNKRGAFMTTRVTTTQRDAITSVQNGMIIYNTTTGKFQGYAGGAWVDLH